MNSLMNYDQEFFRPTLAPELLADAAVAKTTFARKRTEEKPKLKERLRHCFAVRANSLRLLAFHQFEPIG